jgi:iron complex outermembrane receptor protein
MHISDKARAAPWPVATALCTVLLSAGTIAQVLPTPVPVAETPTPIELGPLTIEENMVPERADGPVIGYRATRTATGTKTDTALKDVPQSIQVVPSEVIQDQQVQRLTDVLQNVSGVQSATTGGNKSESFTIRGFRVSDYAIDGIMINPALETSEIYRDLANIERVEVLKGPASVLYGRGDPGGLVNLVTKKPQFDPLYETTLQAGGRDFYRGQFDVTGALDSEHTLAGRLIGAAQTDGGFRHSFRQSEREFLAPSLRWQPNSDTRIDIGVTHTSDAQPFDRGLVAVGKGVTLPIDRYLGETWSKISANKTELNYAIERVANDWLTIHQSGHFDRAEVDRLSADPVSLKSNNRTLTRQASEEHDRDDSIDLQADGTAKYSTGPISHVTVLGFEYSYAVRRLTLDRATLASIDILNPVYGAQPGTFKRTNDRHDQIDLYGAYLQDQAALTEQIKILAGVRLDSYDQADIYQGRNNTASDANLSPRLGVVYQPVTWLSLFSDYTRSFQPNPGASFSGQAFSPETGEQVEVGAKFDIIADRLSATSSLFQLTRQHVLESDPVNSGFSIETGEQRARGAEVDIAGDLAPGWKVILSGSYLQAVITKDQTYAAGAQVINAPKFSGSVWSTYQFGDGPLRGVGFGGGVFTASSRAGDLDNSFRIGGYARVDATAFYDVTPKLRLSVAAHNLLDAHYIESATSRTEIYPAAPVTVTAGLRYRF